VSNVLLGERGKYFAGVPTVFVRQLLSAVFSPLCSRLSKDPRSHARPFSQERITESQIAKTK